MYSDQIFISNLTFVNSPAWNIHPVYSSNIIISGVTILAPVRSPNTDGINPVVERQSRFFFISSAEKILEIVREMSSDGFLKDILIIMGLIGVQTIYGTNTVFLTNVFSLGLNPLFLVYSGSMATSILLIPCAIKLERRQWPKRLTLTSLIQFVLIGFGSVTVFQILMFLGMRKTAPAIATAMPNLGPGLIFVIASIFRFEKFDIHCKYTRAKIFGTIVCLSGAIAISFLQSPPSSPAPHKGPLGEAANMDWTIGCLYLLVAVVSLACSTVLMAATMINFPAPLSLCAISSFVGSILTVPVQLLVDGGLNFGAPSISITTILTAVIVLGVATAVTGGFQTWCVIQKGPVLVTIFNPIQTVCCTILSAITLGQVISLGSFAGILLMFTGLYIVLWAKKKEGPSSLRGDEKFDRGSRDIEEPLIS